MQTRPIQRALSFGLSLVITLAMLMGIRGLSAHEEAAARYAMCSVQRA